MMFGVVYIVLGLIAYKHVMSEDKQDRMGALSPWWAFYDDLFNDAGKRLCKMGKTVFGLFAAAAIAYVAHRGF